MLDKDNKVISTNFKLVTRWSYHVGSTADLWAKRREAFQPSDRKITSL